MCSLAREDEFIFQTIGNAVDDQNGVACSENLEGRGMGKAASGMVYQSVSSNHFDLRCCNLVVVDLSLGAMHK